MINTDFLSFVKLKPDTKLEPFDCGDTDLNSFLSEDAKNYYEDFMGVTYLVKYDQKTVAYYCLFNDKIVFDFSSKEDPGRSWWKSFIKKNKIHFKKQRKNYPAVKIGRLAVTSDFKGNNIGSYILTFVERTIVNTRDIGCRFITVDAYQDAFGFYLKNDFEFLSAEDENDNTRLMYYDLKQIP
jgi:GNAT superfamily N-acetyltransferase